MSISVVFLLTALGVVYPYPQPAPIHPPNTAKRVKLDGYPSETHRIVTEDNYILTAFRIPHSRDNDRSSLGPLILQHGILCSSDCWVIPESRALAYILSDAGYDVWLTNSRGNTYSREHVNLTSKDPEFWNFSFHELGYYDLPATIDYILKGTGKDKLIYVGHSQGTAIFFVMASTRPEYNNKVKVMSALAPIAYLDHTKGAIQSLSRISTWLVEAAHVLKLNHVLDRSIVLALADHVLCTLNWEICDEVISFIVGFDSEHLDKSLVPYLSDVCPTGASIKQLEHFNQLVKNGGKFTWFDYGNKNMIVYNVTYPPEYNLSAITVPILLYYGPNDYISSVSEVKHLNSRLRTVAEIKEISTYNHLDFMWAIDVKEFLYNHLLSVLERY